MIEGSDSSTLKFADFFPGNKQDAVYHHLLVGGQGVDSTLKRAHRRFKMAGVTYQLRNNNSIEYTLNLLACTWHSMVYGDPEGARSMLAWQPPGTGGLLPGWALSDVRSQSKVLYQEAERRAHGWGSVDPNVTPAPPIVNAPTTRLRVSKAKAKPVADPKAKGKAKAKAKAGAAGVDGN